MTLKDIAKQKGLPFSDHLKITSLETREAKNGKTYGIGHALDLYGARHSFKIWDSVVLETVQTCLAAGPVVILKASGTTDVYQDAFSLRIEGVVNADPSITAEEFLTTNYTIPELMTRAAAVYKTKVSEEGQHVISALLAGTIAQRFSEEFAASSVHDAVRHGLLAHTTKMLEIGELVHRQHIDLFQTQAEIDLFYIGLLFHDIGKIVEYAYGVRTDVSFVSHQVLGIEIINAQVDLIESVYSKNWYYHLVSILTQHHGVYGLRPQTTMAYLVHLVDSFEAHVTIFTEKFIEDAKAGKTSTTTNLDNERVYLTHLKM